MTGNVLVILREHDFDVLARATVAPDRPMLLSRLDGDKRVIHTTREERASIAQAFIRSVYEGVRGVPIEQYNRILKALTMVEEADA